MKFYYFIPVLLVLITTFIFFRKRKKDNIKINEQIKKQVIEIINESKKVELSDLEKEIKERRESIKELIEQCNIYEQKEREKILEKLFFLHEEKIKELEAKYRESEEVLLKKRSSLEVELQASLQALNLTENRVKAINKSILEIKERANEEEFYKLHLPETSKEDIAYLLSIESKINNKELLRKLIWSEYIQVPLRELINRITEGKTVKNAIYSITYLPTGERYIGRTTNLNNRLVEHIKASLGIGKIATSTLHTRLYSNWDKFLFEIIEKDVQDLNTTEKYYIQLFQTDKIGLNMKS